MAVVDENLCIEVRKTLNEKIVSLEERTEKHFVLLEKCLSRIEALVESQRASTDRITLLLENSENERKRNETEIKANKLMISEIRDKPAKKYEQIVDSAWKIITGFALAYFTYKFLK